MGEDKKECPHCFSEIDDRATVCPQCHRDIVSGKIGSTQGKEPIRGNWGWILLAAIIGFSLGSCGTFALTQTSNQSSADDLVPIPSVDIYRQVSAEGMIVPANYATLSFPSDSIVSEVLVEKGDKLEAGTPLILSEGTANESQLHLAAEQLTEAEIKLDSAQNQLNTLASSESQQIFNEALKEAQSGLDLIYEALADAPQTLEYGTLKAPIAGTVAKVTVREGETVLASTPVVIVADLNNWLVKTTDLTELDIAGVTVGDSVQAWIDAIPGETLEGKVIDIANVSNQERGDVLYEVTVELEETNDLPLRWGMTANVEIGSN